MSDMKTTLHDGDVVAFLNGIEDEKKRTDCFAILKMMEEVTQLPPQMWGASIVGFGKYHYKYETGREGDMFLVGFSPRKQNIVLYVMPGFDRFEELLTQLGKHKIGKSCLYVKRLSDVKQEVLKNIIADSFEYMKEKYGV